MVFSQVCEGSVYSSWRRPCKFIKLSAVGGGCVSLTRYVLLWGFTSWKLRSFLELISLLLFRQPYVQFSLQGTRPLKDCPRNKDAKYLPGPPLHAKPFLKRLYIGNIRNQASRLPTRLIN